MAYLQFLCIRASPDIQTAMSFLTKSVQTPEKDDWGKINGVFHYIKGTICMKLVLPVDNLNTMWWWMDVSYDVHSYYKDHMVVVMSLDRRAAMSISPEGRK